MRMAAFKDNDADLLRLDFRLLRDGPTTLYFQPSVLADDCAWLASHGYRRDRFDCSTWLTSQDAHAQLATTLEFPDYYGHNLDAFNDCMSYVEIPDEGGRALVLSRYDVLNRAMPEFAAHVLDIVATQSRHHLLFGRRLIALVQSDDPDIAFEPVGACAVGWNPRERLYSTRGN
jgi:hypothetical protein